VVTYKSYAQQAKRAVSKAVLDGATDGAEIVLNDSQQIVPLDESPLKESGAVTVTQDAVYISYGRGESAEYAVIQHENLNYAHAPGRQAKYLETPFRVRNGVIIQKIKDRIKNL